MPICGISILWLPVASRFWINNCMTNNCFNNSFENTSHIKISYFRWLILTGNQWYAQQGEKTVCPTNTEYCNQKTKVGQIWARNNGCQMLLQYHKDVRKDCPEVIRLLLIIMQIREKKKGGGEGKRERWKFIK